MLAMHLLHCSQGKFKSSWLLICLTLFILVNFIIFKIKNFLGILSLQSEINRITMKNQLFKPLQMISLSNKP